MATLPILKVFIAAAVIAFASWLSQKKPELAGFIVALPLVSILALLFSYLEFKNNEATVTFAKSILIGVPISYLFFIPFFFSERLHLGFWGAFLSGLVLLVIGFFIHQAVMLWLR
ncbi:hypothetical protein [Teredinibacter turnerae]|uniref:hypothetical protein n=1 Tax=Teredinibacter turnerae TaxID=2426 RepID=UPI0003F63831|nr:hypothetical protein [Teredinibacter turnerae]